METNQNADSLIEFEDQESSSNETMHDSRDYRIQFCKMKEKKNLFCGLMVLFIITSLVLFFLYLSVAPHKNTPTNAQIFEHEEYKKLLGNYNSLLSDYAELQNENDSLNTDISTLNYKVNELLEEISELKEQLSPSPVPSPTPNQGQTTKPGEEYNTGLTFKMISRNPEKYKGQKVKFSGNVLQIIEGTASNDIRMSTNGNYDDVIYATYDTSILDFRLLEDDHITIYGTFVEMLTYETIFGESITLPGIYIEFIELDAD